jgi:malate synthase
MSSVPGLTLVSPLSPAYSSLLSPDALEFLCGLHRTFHSRIQNLLAERVKRQQEIDSGQFPQFRPETEQIRQGKWRGPSIPSDLQDRRVEITGPTDRKMVINALNSGAKVFMADFEDATSPTWQNLIEGQINLRDAVNRTIQLEVKGKLYVLSSQPAVLMVRPRGLHLSEAHILIDGQVMDASLFDFGVFFFHNAKSLIARGSGPYFYLPKLESFLEARLWNDVFTWAQNKVKIPHGTIRATVLIETILGAFDMEEILYELRDHSAGLNCGRWDYIFSLIKKFRCHSKFLLPDRSQVTMDTSFMANYVALLIRVCHSRGVHAMGGMAAQIPVPGNAKLNEAAFKKVENDKLQEVQRGHDGTWVAHPALIPVAMKVFNQHMKTSNQIAVVPKVERLINAADLLEMGPRGTISIAGIRNNFDVSIRYTEAWLRGNGCVPLHHLMEDAATAEIARCQLWQWLHHAAKLDNDQLVSAELLQDLLSSEVEAIRKSMSPAEWYGSQFPLAIRLVEKLVFDQRLEDFLTSVAYPHLLRWENERIQSVYSQNKGKIESKL